MKTFQKIYNRYGFRIVEVLLILFIIAIIVGASFVHKQIKLNEEILQNQRELLNK